LVNCIIRFHDLRYRGVAGMVITRAVRWQHIPQLHTCKL